MTKLKHKVRASFDEFRDRLSYDDALPQLVSLGVLAGLAASLLIVAFRWLVETPLTFFLDGEVDGFESLPLHWRFLLPFVGAVCIGMVLRFVDPKNRAVSVSHVLDRLHNHQGRLPGGNIIVQFFGGVVALITGQSVGREGPGVHLGSGVASLLGQYYRLPNNSLRTLVACGSAAAISAAFDTPMAGVVFAMEVILMEYTIIGFIPVIIASVLGATISQLVFGPELSIAMTSVQENLLEEIPFMVLSGLVFSIAAAVFIKLHLSCFHLHHFPLEVRFIFIGLITGLVAVYVPEIMGTGYDTLNSAMLGNITVELLLMIVIAKLAVTAIATGLGMLGGLIGPLLIIGGCLGGLLGVAGNIMVPSASNPDFYVALGMVAMMGAVLNAPLAALVAILELSNSPGIIFPSMITVVVACLGVQQLFGYQGVFAEQLRFHGHDILAEPGKGFLSRVGVGSVMNRSFAMCDQSVDQARAQQLVDKQSLWLVMEKENSYGLLATADLARYRTETEDLVELIDLDSIAAKPHELALVDSLANLHEASAKLRDSGADALLVIESIPYSDSRVVGVITRATVMNYYGM